MADTKSTSGRSLEEKFHVLRSGAVGLISRPEKLQCVNRPYTLTLNKRQAEKKGGTFEPQTNCKKQFLSFCSL